MTPDTRIEIRVPTYRRPDLLRRCLEAIRAQTHRDFVCCVFDDCPDGSAGEVVKHLGDERFLAFRSPRQLGASENIDKSFRRLSSADARYFCVVEDDNYIEPEFLAKNVADMQRYNVRVLMRNQWVEAKEGGVWRKLDRDILSLRFRRTGVLPPQIFRLSGLFSEGISNGGLFWSREAMSNFELGDTWGEAGLDEYRRTLRLEDDILIALEPLAVWRANEDESLRDSRRVVFRWWHFLRSAAIIQRLRKEIHDRDFSGIDVAVLRESFSISASVWEIAVRRIARPWPFPTELSLGRRLDLAFKALLLSFVSMFVGNPDSYHARSRH